MSTKLKRMLTILLSAAVVLSMCIPAVFADTDTSSDADEMTSTVHMFQPAEGNVTYGDIDQDDATVEVTFTVGPQSRKYTKLAFVTQARSDTSKNKNAVTAETKETSDGKYTSTFTVEIPASKLGRQMPISLYQQYTSSDGTAVDGWHDFSKTALCDIQLHAGAREEADGFYLRFHTAYRI